MLSLYYSLKHVHTNVSKEYRPMKYRLEIYLWLKNPLYPNSLDVYKYRLVKKLKKFYNNTFWYIGYWCRCIKYR